LTALIFNQLQAILNRSIQDTTHRFAGIQLQEQAISLSDDICSIHTVFQGGHTAAVTLYADTAFLIRMAQRVIHSQTVSPQDVEDVATEYFNIICGRISAGLFQSAQVSSRFCCPRFYRGRYLPCNRNGPQCVLNYSSSQNERAQLIYIGPISPDPSREDP
jgi:hypothetical protein